MGNTLENVKVGEVIWYNLNNQDNYPYLVYIVNIIDDTYYLYTCGSHQLYAVEVYHNKHTENNIEQEEYYESEPKLVCDYIVIPEADYILKRD